MKYRTLDENGDSTYGSRKFLTAHEAVAQAIITRLRLLYGEWWENTADGLPLWNHILSAYGGNAVRDTVDLLISERILGTQNVTEIVTYESNFDPQTRQYTAYCIVNTSFGQVTLNMQENLTRIEVM